MAASFKSLISRIFKPGGELTPQATELDLNIPAERVIYMYTYTDNQGNSQTTGIPLSDILANYIEYSDAAELTYRYSSSVGPKNSRARIWIDTSANDNESTRISPKNPES